MNLFRTLAVAMLVAMPASAWAHFVWVVAGPSSPDGKVHVYFSEAAEPDEPKLLERLAGLKLQQVSQGTAQSLPVVRGEDSLESSLAGSTPGAFVISHTYGVLTKGEETFLLQYHAKAYNTDQPMLWTAVAQPELLPLEITPQLSSGVTKLHVTWQGKPLAKGVVTIEAEGMDNLEGETDERGTFAAPLALGKLYSIRVKHTEPEKGSRDGKDYASVRHYSTLSLKLPAEVNTAGLPPFEPPVTSFGAAIVDDVVYTYGGHLGSAHHYSDAGQSSRFARLDLKSPSKWEQLADVPKRTGLAMVPYKGTVIRIGGFEARNKEGDKEQLVSMADVAQFNLATNAWTELTALPAGRSSHDAVVIGDKLYVVGGWQMSADAETVWHEKALVADLTQTPLVWQEIPGPQFLRRALSVGEWQGRLIAVGGMQEQGGPTRKSSIYDAASQTWTDGPELQGTAMDGFGSSAFATGDTLYVSTMGGQVQRLSHDGKRFDVIGQLQHPRFFHRMLPTSNGRLLFIGGASMQTGKVTELEIFSPQELTTASR